MSHRRRRRDVILKISEVGRKRGIFGRDRDKIASHVERLPSVIVSLMMEYLPLESFGCDHTYVALVCRCWRIAARACRAHIRVTHTNIQWLHRLCRIPLVTNVDADHLDETLVHALSRVRGLRSLVWRSPLTTTFDALPTILRDNPQLATLTGNHRYFSALCPISKAYVARECERLLAQRPAANINGVHATTCVCGERRIFTVRCRVPYCPTFRATPLVLLKSSATDLHADIALLTEAKAQWPADEHLPWLSGMAARFLDRLTELSTFSEHMNTLIQVQTRQLAAAKLGQRELRAEIVELRGELAYRGPA
jgi:hypothetical protein